MPIEFIVGSILIVILNFILLSAAVVILAWFGYFPEPEWMKRFKGRR